MLLGLPGLVAYKAINTAIDDWLQDKKHQAFGWAAARLDDLVNLIPARLTGLIYALLAKDPAHALKVMMKDAPRHRFPMRAGGIGGCVSARHSPVRPSHL